ncbi:tetratricopeptide repeat protein [Mycobacterium sp. URHB0021]
MRCGVPGCGGTIAAGYCDACGVAPTAKGAERFQPTRQASGSPTAGPGRAAHIGLTKPGAGRGRLGAGLVAIPPVPKGDPAAAILVDPQVPEHHRFCGNHRCNEPVGRGRDGRPGPTEGACTQCGMRFSFVPKLSRGNLLGGQYDIQGCIAHGGLGWIYLAIDRNVDNRWVVLKGLVNSSDADAMDAAATEARALAKVEHPNIVKIHNFVEHADAAGVPVGYIVMEYVGGTSLKQLRRAGPLPPSHAVAYIVEIAPAIDYLHSQGLAYCDFKPDNVMQSDEQLKLIDLGAMVDMDDEDSSIYGTPGYQAPEIAHTGPTVATEVYTVGRTLAALVMDVPQGRGRFGAELPGPAAEPVFARHESLYRAIVRATDPDPARRFPSMDEMADQLTGVLHEIVAAETDIARPRRSSCFSPQRAVFGAGKGVPVRPADVIAALHVPVVDPEDPGAAVLATTSGTPPAQLDQAVNLAMGGASQGTSASMEIPLRLVRASLETGAAADARQRLTELGSVMAGDWRLKWYCGQCALLEGEFDKAAADFDAVLAMLPGELAPKLAIAATAELHGARDDAVRYYEMVWRTEHSYYSAAFGLARLRARMGDWTDAVAALDQVPSSSAHFTVAGATAIEILLDGREPENADEQTLLDAGERTAALNLESAEKRATIRLKVLSAALDWLRAGNQSTATHLLGVPFDEPGIQTGMERAYRDLARVTTGMWDRIAMVEKANAIRPRTRL